MQCLRLLKLLHGIGIYGRAVGGITEITGDDYYELALLGLEHVAPIYSAEDLGDEWCCGGHTVHRFSSPAMTEYYRLCRLYEHRHGTTPGENPHVARADDHYARCLHNARGSFGSSYEDEKHPRGIWIETCPEHYACELELIALVHSLMGFYSAGAEALRMELLRGPAVYLPALPAPGGQKMAEKPPDKQGGTMKKGACHEQPL